MAFYQRYLPKNLTFGSWMLVMLALVAAQCQSPAMPPLSSPPATPAITVAVLSPTSGELDTFGQRLRNGIQLAFDEWNTRGGVNGSRLEWALYPADCTFAGGQQAVRQALADGHTLLLGPLCAEAAIAAAIKAEAGGALLIAPAAPQALVTVNPQGQTRPTIFKASYAAGWQGQAAAQFAQTDFSATRAAILFANADADAAELARAFAAAFAGQVVYQQSFDPAVQNFSELLAATRQANAELVYLPASPQLANQLGPQVLAQGFRLLGSDGWDAPDLDRAKLTGAAFPVHFWPTENRPTVQNFVERYKSTYAVAPDTLAALGYDSANVLAQAIQQANNSQPQAVAHRLAANQFEGVAGPFSFDAAHNPRPPVLFITLPAGQTVITP